jgi:integrase
VRSLTDAEAQGLLAKAGTRPVRQRLILRLLLEYDLTPHEICRLTGDDVSDSSLRVTDKRGQPRTVELQAEAAAELAEMSASAADQQLLAGRSGSLQVDAIRRLVAAAALDADLDGEISIHRAARRAGTRA